MTIQANQGPGVSIFGATSAGGGGSTSPGGSSGQVQYNNGGSFGGMSGTTWTDASQSLAIASTGTGTGITSSTPVLNLSQTWNAGAVTFTGLKFNATDTASASGSLLLDLQVGGTSQFLIDKSGNVGLYANSVLRIGSSSVNWGFIAGLNGPYVRSDGYFGFYSGTNLASGGSIDTRITRGGTATLQLGAADAAAPVAQTLQVQSVVAGTSNTAGTNWTLKGSAGTGTGAGGSIIFQVAPAGSSGTAQNAYATALTIAQNRGVDVPNYLTIGAGGNSQIGLNYAGGGALSLSTTGSLTWGTASSINNPDVYLYRDAANTLALRNGTNAQTFNTYITYTDASNYQRVVTGYDSVNAIYGIGMVGAGTGLAASSLEIANQLGGIYFRTGNLAAGTRRWNITNGGDFLAVADNTYDIGASGASRPRNVYIASNLSLQGGSSTLTMSSTGYITFAGKDVGLDAPSSGNWRLTNTAGTDFGRLIFGGTTSSFPALKRSSARLQVTDATGAFGQNTGVDTANVAYQGVTFANLPTAAAGIVAYVTDASNAGAAWGDSVTAGGSTNKYLVWYNGTNWTVIGK